MRVKLLTSVEEDCGIADYSRSLIRALHSLPAAPAPPGVEVLPLPRQAPPSVYAALGTALNDADVAHVQHAYSFFGGMHPLHGRRWRMLLQRVRVPLLVTLHEFDARGTGAHRLPPGLERRYKTWFNRRSFLHPAIGAWHTHAQEIRQALLDFGVPPSRVFWNPLPVELPQRPVSGEQARERWGLAGRRVLVMAGFLAQRKGYDTALEALRLLPESCVLLAAGGAHPADGGAPEAVLYRRAEELGVADRFRITGFLPSTQLEEALAAADLVLAPFHHVSSSASLNLALAHGCAVVASDLPAWREVGGLERVPPADPRALAAAITRLLDDASARRRLQEAAHAEAAARSFSSLAQELATHYAELAGVSRESPG